MHGPGLLALWRLRALSIAGVHDRGRGHNGACTSRGQGKAEIVEVMELQERMTKLGKVLTDGLLKATVNAGIIVEAATSAARGCTGPCDVRGAMSTLTRRIAESDT